MMADCALHGETCRRPTQTTESVRTPICVKFCVKVLRGVTLSS